MQRPAASSVRVLEDVMVPMRDGVRLATDIYLPAEGAAPWPVILERTPYDKAGASRSERSLHQSEPMTRPEVACYFARHGYAVVMQDCRGRYGSEGRFVKYLDEARDGFETVVWIREQGWCDGRIGTMGLSYGAHTQLALACLAPAGLSCMFIDSGGFSSAFHAGIRRGGAFELKQATWAYRHALLSQATARDPHRRAELERVDLRQWFRRMPWMPGDSPLAAAPEYEAYLFEQWREGTLNAYWQRMGLYAEGYYGQIPDIPVAIVGSWYDPYAGACLDNYRGLAGRRSAVSLLMGPWTHGDRSQTHAGAVDFGAASTLDDNISADYLGYRLEWFNACLRDTGDGARGEVRWFEMGGGSGRRDARGRLQHGGRWKSADRWPPAGQQLRPLYLDAGMRLRGDPPAAQAAFVDFTFDPGDPVPTIGGALTSGEPIMSGGAFDQRVTEDVFCYRADHPRIPLAQRPDVLVFQTEPLANDLVVTGEVSAELWVGSDAPDSDITIKLVDVYPPSEDYPDGFAMNICDGILRLRLRDGWAEEHWMTPGEAYRVRVSCLPTSNRFRAGHRLRLDVSSSNYPQFDINPNTAMPAGVASTPRVARNRVYADAAHPSRLLLPVCPAEDPHAQSA